MLAISVVFAHTYGVVFVGGRNAVQVFYMISGFLITYVLVYRESYTSSWQFYKSRYIRLFPLYFIVLILTVSSSIYFHNIEKIEYLNTLPLSARALVTFANIFIVSQDWLMFVLVYHGHFDLVTSFGGDAQYLYKGIFIPQAWTLGVEITFYVIAPYVVKHSKRIFGLLLASILLRIFFIEIGLGLNDPWIYRFFPTELAFFLGGSVSCHVYMRLRKLLDIDARLDITYIFLIANIVYLTIYPFIVLSETGKILILFPLVFISLPFLFTFQNRSRTDKYIGELSYPIYIVHMFIVEICANMRGVFGNISQLSFALICVFITILVSIVVKSAIVNPIEKYRISLREQN